MSRLIALIARTWRQHDAEFGAGAARRETQDCARAFPFLVILLYLVAIMFDGTGG